MPFGLCNAPSNDGLGVVLSQEQDGRARPIAYASLGLHPAEKNYKSMKLEFLAMKLVMTHNHDYLLGHKCTAWTENFPLSHLVTAKLVAREHQWVAELAVFDYMVWDPATIMWMPCLGSIHTKVRSQRDPPTTW